MAAASIRVSSTKTLLTLQELFTNGILTSACVYTCPSECEDSGDVVLEDAELVFVSAGINNTLILQA